MDLKRRPIIAPSILSADFGRLAEEVQAVERAGADWIHVDVMDGNFVPNITVGALAVAAAREVCELPLDVHLMVRKPERYLEDFAGAGAHILTVHVEASLHLHRTLQAIKALGVRPAVSLNPATPLSSAEEVLSEVEMVLLMSVNPGFGGQSFIPATLDKIARLRHLIDRRNPGVLLQVDGGITVENAPRVIEAGADVLVAGTAVFKSQDYAGTIAALRGREARFRV